MKYFLLSLSFLLLPGVLFAKAPVVINDYNSDIQIQESGDVFITETLSTTFNERRHGIFRHIPLKYTDTFFSSQLIGINVLSVTKNGEPEPFDKTRGSSLVLKIGDPDIYIDGDHTYEIQYQASRVIQFFDTFDEFYWNVTGDDWEMPIMSVGATVSIPETDSIHENDSRGPVCFTGIYGSTESNCTVKNVNSSTVTFSADSAPLTIAVPFDKQLVNPPSLFENIYVFFLLHWFSAISLLFLLISYYVWFRFGKDSKIPSSVVVQYDPKMDLPAVYSGMLLSDGISEKHISAMIVQLAEWGYIRIHADETEGEFLKKKKTNYTLEKQSSSKPLDTHHKKLLNLLFSKSEKMKLSTMKTTVKKSEMTKLKNQLKKELVTREFHEKHSFRNRTIFIVFGTILVFGLFEFGFGLAILDIIIGIVCGILIIILGQFMTKRTEMGIQTIYHLKGFKMYMETAEKYRSQWQEEKNLFVKLLPYAVAFGITEKWAKQFKNIAKKLGPSPTS